MRQFENRPWWRNRGQHLLRKTSPGGRAGGRAGEAAGAVGGQGFSSVKHHKIN